MNRPMSPLGASLFEMMAGVGKAQAEAAIEQREARRLAAIQPPKILTPIRKG